MNKGLVHTRQAHSTTEPQHIENSWGQRLCSSGFKCKKTWFLCMSWVDLEKALPLLKENRCFLCLKNLKHSIFMSLWSAEPTLQLETGISEVEEQQDCKDNQLLIYKRKGPRSRGPAPSALPTSPSRNNKNKHTRSQLPSQALTTFKGGS